MATLRELEHEVLKTARTLIRATRTLVDSDPAAKEAWGRADAALTARDDLFFEKIKRRDAGGREYRPRKKKCPP